jgi:hypothetical protein
MTSSNIAIVFGPSVLYPQEDSLEATLKMPRFVMIFNQEEQEKYHHHLTH